MARKKQRTKPNMLFDAWNYKALITGLLLITAGFTAMYLENEVHGFISLYISPVVIMGGYVAILLGILKKHGDEADANGQTAS